jgi:hypothetical protein
MIAGSGGEGHLPGDAGHWTYSTALLLRKFIKTILKEETD